MWPLRDRVVGTGTDGDARVRGHRCGSVCRRSGVRRGGAGRARAAPVGRSRPRPPPRAPARRGGPPTAGARGAPPAGTGGRGRQDRIGRRCPMRRRGSAGRRSRRTSAAASSASRLALTARIAAAASSTNVTLSRAARERLEAERAGAGEQVEHPRAVDRGRPGSRTAPRAPGPRSGRVASPGGALRLRPPYVPAITRTAQPVHAPAAPRSPGGLAPGALAAICRSGPTGRRAAARPRAASKPLGGRASGPRGRRRDAGTFAPARRVRAGRR